MGDDTGEERPLDILANIKVSEDVWGEHWPDADGVAKIRHVQMHDPGANISGLQNEMQDIKRNASRDRPTKRKRTDHRWRHFRNLEEDINEELNKLSNPAVIVVLELPDGSDCFDIFELPAKPTDKFYKLCAEGLEIDPGSESVLTEGKIVGRTVPVTRDGRRWRIDVPHALNHTSRER